MRLRQIAKEIVGRSKPVGRRLVSPSGNEEPSSLLLSKEALEVSRSIRFEDRAPSVMIYGVVPRSGTVYVGKVLGLHPDLYGHPNQLWEIPFLESTPDLITFQEGFFSGYRGNRNRMGNLDYLPMFGSAYIRYLQSFAPMGGRI